ncbi:MAG: mandelate racemase/muconate lactonizing enzyme family protein [Thermomicrobiales bacterium]|nr:mandelate racemase/muconate lactonizing enzyme family protein [Thermomicrobiales bacterium]
MTAALTFTKFRVWQVVVPARQDIIGASPPKGSIYRDGLTWPEVPICLVEGVTSEGFTAVGEADRGVTRETVDATLRDLLGRNLLEMSPSTAWMQTRAPSGLPLNHPAWSWEVPGDWHYFLMESLWFDAIGKAVGLPAHRLMGGAVRDVVPADFWANRPPAKTLAKLVEEAQSLGLKGIKMKCDAHGDMVNAVLEIAGDVDPGFRFTIDPMHAWRSFREGGHFFEKLARLEQPVQIEDPFPKTVEDDWRRARQIGPLTIVVHPRGMEGFRHALREGLGDAYNLGGGSVTEFQRTSTVAEFSGKDCWHGSSIEMGVLQALRLHASSTARNCVLASDLCSEWVREHTLVQQRMEYRDGGAVVPNRPGLGVDLDHAAVEKYAIGKWEVGE